VHRPSDWFLISVYDFLHFVNKIHYYYYSVSRTRATITSEVVVNETGLHVDLK